MYRDLKDIFLQYSQRNIINQENEVPATQNLTNFEITNDKTCFKDFTELLCLDIQKKIYIIERLHKLVITFDMNENENEKKLYGIFTNFIRKLTDFFL